MPEMPRIPTSVELLRPQPDETLAPPLGYRTMHLSDPFEAFVGPFFEREDESGNPWLAFYVDARHVNASGYAHEGMLMTFADAALGSCTWNANDRKPCVTLSMQMSLLQAPKLGDLIECRAQLTRKTTAIIFASAEFFVGGTPMVTFTSLWKIIGAR